MTQLRREMACRLESGSEAVPESGSEAVPELGSELGVAGSGAVSLRWQPVLVEQVTIRAGKRGIDPAHTAALKASFAMLGGQLQLQPILVDCNLVLIDGAHRLEAAKQSGWKHIAALVVSSDDQINLARLTTEANRVRRGLSVIELEEVWRTHFEPELRADARRRQLEAPRRSPHPPMKRLGPSPESLANPVIGVSDNRGGSAAESLTSAAKRITGFSLDTLNKVSQIRALSTADGVPTELRSAAAAGLERLAKPGVSVESVYRALRNLQERTQGAATDIEVARAQAEAAALEHVLSESTLLSERLSGPLSAQIIAAAGRSPANRELLRATRVSLAHSLATVVALECNLESTPRQALTHIGREVSRLLSNTSRARLSRDECVDKRESSSQSEFSGRHESGGGPLPRYSDARVAE